MRDDEAVDVNAALCRRLPTRVIAQMMGVPDAVLRDVERWSDAMAGGGSAYLADDPAAAVARPPARRRRPRWRTICLR